ncbi:hypothetical protein, partial [Escherichia coli]|uniref:hypothetical protein n=1 Tax=Escherichia coli TaxID=562 RepID=UPI001CCB4E79
MKVVDEYGVETVQSLTLEDIKKFNEGSLFNKSSLLHNAQRVEVIEPDFIRTIALEEPISNKAAGWGTERVGVDNLKKSLVAVDGEVIVSIIDTGVDDTHPFLKGRII